MRYTILEQVCHQMIKVAEFEFFNDAQDYIINECEKFAEGNQLDYAMSCYQLIDNERSN